MASLYVGWKNVAGLLCLCVGRWSIHIGVQRSHWVWGYEQDWYDGPIHHWGLGPLFLAVYY